MLMNLSSIKFAVVYCENATRLNRKMPHLWHFFFFFLQFKAIRVTPAALVTSESAGETHTNGIMSYSISLGINVSTSIVQLG